MQHLSEHFLFLILQNAEYLLKNFSSNQAYQSRGFTIDTPKNILGPILPRGGNKKYIRRKVDLMILKKSVPYRFFCVGALANRWMGKPRTTCNGLTVQRLNDTFTLLVSKDNAFRGVKWP